MDHKYEIDWTRYYPDNGHHTIIAMLTGLPIEDIEAAAPAKDLWCPRDYIQAFEKLGFNTSGRFIKFHPKTDKPCMMRYRHRDTRKGYWNAEVYYDHQVHCGNSTWEFDQWLKYWAGLVRVTSMLQVWI